MSNPTDDEQALLHFLADINCLKPLYNWVDDFNFFNVLRLSRTEIRHSNVLSWLLDPKENHGFGSDFLYGFITHLCNVIQPTKQQGLNDINFISLLASNLSSFTVRREWNHIDILVFSEELKTVIAIENKIDSSVSQNRNASGTQLNTYDASLRKEFKGWQCARVLLAPNQDKFKTLSDTWCRMEYKDITPILEECFGNSVTNLKHEQKVFIQNYIRLLKHELNMDDIELKRICNGIYVKHRRALDLILEYKDDPAKTIAECCRKWISEKQHNNPTTFRRKDDKSLLFVTDGLQKCLNTDDAFQYFFYQIEIRFDPKNERVNVNLSLVFHNDNNTTHELLHRMRQVDPKIPEEFVWRRAFGKTEHFSEGVDESKVHQFLEKEFNAIEGKIQRWLS